MTDDPLVSIIMNCFNGEKYVHEAIESVLRQCYRNWEIIFWDNQSTDRSAEIFRGYADSRLKYFRAPKHSLLYAARNGAIAQATGKFIAFLDVDDRWRPDKLAIQVPLFRDEEVGFACSNYWIFEEQRNNRRRLFRKKPLPTGWVTNEILANYPVGLLTLIVRRAAFDSLATGCDASFHIIGDIDLVLRLSLRWKMESSQQALADYRLHGENEGQKRKELHVQEYQRWIGELSENPAIRQLPGFGKAREELIYMQGRLFVRQKKWGAAWRSLADLPWGRYKLKLLLSLLLSFRVPDDPPRDSN